MQSKFRIDSISWFLTYPKCTLTKEEALEKLKAKRDIKAAVIALENHADGTPHIHAFLQLSKQLSCRNQSFWDLDQFHGNYQKAKSIVNVVKYIKKDGDILEYGDMDWKNKVDARETHSAYLGKRILAGVPLKQLIEEDPSLVLKTYDLQKNINAWKILSAVPVSTDLPRGIWIWGPTGTGKSHLVRQEEPDLFLKAQNKWWDGYINQQAVLIDDLDSDCLDHYLKIWADKYSCTGEVKGGHVQLCYQRFYVTSNFSIEELFKNKPEVTIDAIKRRFKVIHKLDKSLGLSDK